MGQVDFQERLERIGKQPKAVVVGPAGASAAKARSRGFSNRWAAIGGICSAIVLALFVNLQAISDLAPDSVVQSDTPGLYAMPVALLAVVWFAAIPTWFSGGIIMNAIQRKGRILPHGFAVGAFVVLALGLFLFRMFWFDGAV